MKFAAGMLLIAALINTEVCFGSEADSLSPLDVRGFNGIKEMSRPELVRLMTKLRPLTQSENANLDRGCPGLACIYQGLGLTRWPELARRTVAYLNLEDALNRHCPSNQENFIFVKQGNWLSDKPPMSNSITHQVSVNSITRTKPGFYSFGYAVYFPSTRTYAWINSILAPITFFLMVSVNAAFWFLTRALVRLFTKTNRGSN